MNLFKKTLVVSVITASLTSCSTLQEYAVKAKDGAIQLSTTVSDASRYDLCQMIRLRDYNRIFNTLEKKKAHAKMCAVEYEVVE